LFWQSHCLAMLRKADKMIVVCIDGWDASVGLKAEIDFCHQCGIPVDYLEV